jgi:hypothetical protein
MNCMVIIVIIIIIIIIIIILQGFGISTIMMILRVNIKNADFDSISLKYFAVKYQYEYVCIYIKVSMNLSIYLNLYAFNISKQICNYLPIDYLHVQNVLIIKSIYFMWTRQRYCLHKIKWNARFHIRYSNFNANFYWRCKKNNQYN